MKINKAIKRDQRSGKAIRKQRSYLKLKEKEREKEKSIARRKRKKELDSELDQ